MFSLTFAPYASDWRPAVAVLAMATVVGGSVVAVVQTDVKRMLAYSSITHAGFILIGVEAASDRGTAAVLAYLAVYTLLAAGSFAVITVVGGSGDADHGLDAYRQLGTRHPVLAGVFAVLLLAQAGVPFTAGFVAKFGVIAAAVDAGSYVVAAVAMAAAAIAAFVYLRILVQMYLTEPDPSGETAGRLVVPTGARVVIGVAVVLVVVIGLAPATLVDLARDAVPMLVQG